MDNYNEKTLAQLREIAKEKEIKNITTLKKQDLIDLLIEYDKNDVDEDKNGVEEEKKEGSGTIDKKTLDSGNIAERDGNAR